MKQSLAVLALCALAAGCAAPEASSDSAERGEYRTGSNIPRKSGSGDRIESTRTGELPRAVGDPGMPR